MKKLIFGCILMIAIIACGERSGQIYNIVKPDEVSTATYRCKTLFNLPVLCLIEVDTEKTIRIVDIVIEVVERIVEVEKIVEVPIETITREVYVIHRDKDVDLEVIIAEVIRRVQASVPSNATAHVPTVIAEVAQAVIESTPYVETDEVEHHVSEPKQRRNATPQVDPIPDPIPDPTPDPTPEGNALVEPSGDSDHVLQGGIVGGLFVVHGGIVTDSHLSHSHQNLGGSMSWTGSNNEHQHTITLDGPHKGEVITHSDIPDHQHGKFASHSHTHD